MKRLPALGLLLCCGCALEARDPVRALVITRSGRALPQAQAAFEKQYGKGLLELEVSGDQVPKERIEKARAIFLYYIPNVVAGQIREEIRAAHRRGALILGVPQETNERYFGLKFDSRLMARMGEYWKYGGVENLTAALALLYQAAGGERKVDVAPPIVQATSGIYYPKAPRVFRSLAEYLEWYGGQAIVPAGAPLAGISFFTDNVHSRDVAHIDALIAALEKRRIGAVPVFGWPISSLDPLFTEGGKCPLRVLFALTLGFGKPDDAVAFERYGVHVINLMVTRESSAQWHANMRGVTPDRIGMFLNAPERAGASEPILFATSELVKGTEVTATMPVEERLEMAVHRAQRWITLQEKPNRDKRIAILYYNNPPGKGNLGASYLNVFPTMSNLLQRLQRAGYRTGDRIPTEQEWAAALEASGRNIELWAPGELDEMVAHGVAALVPVSKYKRWFAKLPEAFRNAVNKDWGPPERARLMTVESKGRERYFVVPGIRVGNIYLGPQPLRSTFERVQNTAHDTLTPVPHSYVAAYLWYRNEFQADAVVHVGRHGTLEWLPGKQVAQEGTDHSEVLLGDLPNAYYYIVDGGGEAIQAKRRSAGVMISHLTPMLVSGGRLKEFEKLHDAFENLEKTDASAPELADEYRSSALAEIRKNKLDRQLGLDLEKMPWSEVESRVHQFLHDTENDPIPMGIHTAGQLPAESVQREALREFIKYGFADSEAAQFAGDLKGWADAIFDGRTPEVSRRYAPALRDKAQTALGEAATWLANLRRSPQMELDALITVLNGRYLPTGPLGDPMKMPAGLPTGRNLHGFDTALIPTRAAWTVGKRMAEQTLARYRKDRGRLPEQMSMVLWYGETERHQGAMESMALYLMGVEPVWNPRGVVDNLRLIPDTALGRPRVNVIFTISGIYRDGMSDKVLLLNRAARLAAAAGDNAISRHDRRVAESLQKSGIDRETAEKIARARVFGTKPGHYGVGLDKMVEQSKDAGNTKGLADVYLHYMNFAFSGDVWGETAPKALESHLRGNETVLFSRSTNLYGILDNDDTYQYVGGLNLASKVVNQGAAPEFYIHNLRKPGSASLVDVKTWLANELNAREWNPKWLQAMKDSGYSGARHIFKQMEHLYGFQATASEKMDGTFWQNSFDVYVADKHGLAMEKFFQKENPHAYQFLLSRMIEVDRQGSYRFSGKDRAALIEKYVRSVDVNGVSCSANTCGNERVHQYIAQQAATIPGLELRTFGQRIARATRWSPADFRSAPAALRAGMRHGLRPAGPAAAMRRSAQVGAQASTRPYVSGYRIREQVMRLGNPAAPRRPLSAGYLAAIAVLIAAGSVRELLRSPRKRPEHS